jgi:hypothetical protein
MVDVPNVTVKARVYTIAGELLKTVEGNPGASQAVWDARGYASGTYFVDMEWSDANGKWMGRKVLKILVAH